MHRVLQVGAIAALVLGAAGVAGAQSVTYDFEDGTDQGFGLKFSGTGDASASFPIVNVAGSQRMQITRTGAFQEADVSTGNPASPLFLAMNAASADEAHYEFSYDWYVDTSTWGANAGTFLQVGSYFNTGSGYYAQDFGTPKEVELNGTQLSSGQVFQGHVAFLLADKAIDLPAAETFFRYGFILNGDGSAQNVLFDNIVLRPVPEPASLALLALPALAIRRRRD